MAECMSDSVEAITRAVKVEAFISWSACRIRPRRRSSPPRVRPLPGEHVEEVGGVGELVVGSDRLEPAAATVVTRDHRRHLGDQPGGLGKVRIDAVRVLVGVVERVRRDGGTQHLHRLGVVGEHVHHRRRLGRQIAGFNQCGREGVELGRGRQVAAQDQEARLPRRSSARRDHRRRSRRRSERRSDRRWSTGGCAQPPHLQVHPCLPFETLRPVCLRSYDFD